MIEVPCFEDWEGGIVELKDSNWVRRAFAFDIPSEGRVVMLNSSLSAFSLVLDHPVISYRPAIAITQDGPNSARYIISKCTHLNIIQDCKSL
jgi:hypothetical protein